MHAVAIIPARYGSQRLPAKPLADIAGKPMIQHVYEQAARASLIERVIVATDDKRIADAVTRFGGTAVMTPVSLASGTDRVAYAAQALPEADIIVNVQGDEPLMPPAMIDEAVRVVTGSDADAGTLVRRIEHEDELFNPSVVKVVLAHGGRCLYFSRSAIPFARDATTKEWLHLHTYYKHIGIYVFRRPLLLRFPELGPSPLERTEKLEQLRILEHGYVIRAAVTLHDSIPVDTPEDLERVRMILRSPS
ncbi:MAG TPA: 3-deoxy-manno-octulosonate cytidylyltransferase [Bacteroidota bacterium]|nr:3-deoxy-manno-octulosonate cytidylyltransferase [Bacteroidota bacterium]